MRFSSLSLSLQRVGAKTTMSSSRFNLGGRNPWRRDFSDHRPPPSFYGVGDFVNEESHMRTVRGENHRYQQGYRGNYWIPRGNPHPQQQFRPRPADHRNWIFARSQPPPCAERFTVVSYNILADYLAQDHRQELYYHIPPHILDWEWRKRRLLLEFGLWSPDIMCLQEVDRFQDLEEELTLRGYAGIWKMRTGNALDGCAIFWRTNRFHLRHEEHIEFTKLGLRDNVAQICVLESRIQTPAETPSTSLHASCGQSNGVNQVVICNIHVLYNPRRGEIKLGQVRVLLDRAYAVAKTCNDAPVIICGDFNCTPKSPLYNFISDQRLFLSGLARNQVSGQYSASIYAPRPYAGSTLYRGPHSKGVEDDSYRKEASASLNKQLSPPQQLKGILGMSEKPFSDSRSILGQDKLSCAVKTEADELGTLDSHSDGTSSTQYGLVDPSSPENGESLNESTDILVNLGNIEKEEESPFTGEVQENHGINISQLGHSSLNMSIKSQLNTERDDKLIHSIDHNFSKNHKVSQGFPDSQAGDVYTSKPNKTSISHDMHTQLNCRAILKEDPSSSLPLNIGCISGSHSGIVSEKIPLNEGFEDKKLDDCRANTSFKMVSAMSSADVETSTLKSMELAADLFRKEMAGTVVSCQNTSNILPDSSTLSNSFNEVGRIMKEDACTEGDHGITNLDTLLEHTEEHATLRSDVDYKFSTKPNIEEVDRQPDISSNACQTNENQLEDHTGAGLGCSTTNDLGNSEDPDPNFYKELLGTEEARGYAEEATSTPCQIQQDSFMERAPYNPYFWTPMEIEVASGNAGCMLVEHSMKLRSAYADVEDYAGTKDSTREPQVTSYHRKFMGTVDYIWFSEGLQTVKVLDTIPKDVLLRTPGFPTHKWGSDHLALASQLAFTKNFRPPR